MDINHALQALGLTEYETRVYLSLLKNYPATGYQISKDSGVPRSMVYEVLARLTQKGYVLESAEERSTIYKPLPPETLLDSHLSTFQTLIQDLKPALNTFYRSDSDHRIWTLNDLDTIYAYARQMLARIKNQAFFVMNDSHIEALDGSFSAMKNPGADIQVLLTGTGNLPAGTITRHPPLESELQEITNTLLIIVDDQQVLMAETGSNPVATITTNPSFLMIAKQFFWMEIFTQRIITKLGSEFIEKLDPTDRDIVMSQIQLLDKESK